MGVKIRGCHTFSENETSMKNEKGWSEKRDKKPINFAGD